MKARNIVLALSSLLLLASCARRNRTLSVSSEPAPDSSVASRTMAFLQDGQYYIGVPNDVIEPVGTKAPTIRINGAGHSGFYIGNLGGKFKLTAEDEFTKDLYLTIARSEEEGHLVVKAYGPIDRENLNEAFAAICEATGVPNKIYLCFSTMPATWNQGYDAEMDEEIRAAWEIHG